MIAVRASTVNIDRAASAMLAGRSSDPVASAQIRHPPERFATRDTLSPGKVQGRNNVRIRALDRLHQLVRFVDIKSGEDLQGIFRRGFQEVLAGALGAAHKKSMHEAAAAREAYQEALGKVLRPIATHIQDRLGRARSRS